MRVLLVQRTLDPPGGGNAVAAWIAQALAGSSTLETMTERPWDAAAVDAFYGTSLRDAHITQHVVPFPWSSMLALPWSLDGRRAGGRLERFRTSVLFRAARGVSRGFDVSVTADNYGAFATPGVQYVHYPAELYPEPTRSPHLVRLYYRMCDAISGLSWTLARRNVTLTNSAWSATGLRSLGMTARVIYPPVVDPGEGLPWRDRDDTFLCIGRFHGSKRLEDVIAVLAQVRQRHPGITLRIVGSVVDAEYMSRLRRIAEPHAAWVRFDEDLPRTGLYALMRSCRYGIHAMVDEHFGMAPAEMARAGMVVFCHASGGLIEVTGGEDRVLWRSVDDAVARIHAVLASGDEAQAALGARLRGHAERFSPERFCEEVRDAVYGSAMDRNAGSSSSAS